MNLKSNIVKLLFTPNSFRNISLLVIISFSAGNFFGQSERSATNLPSDGLPNFDNNLRDSGIVRQMPKGDKKALKQIMLKVREGERKTVPSQALREKYQDFLKNDRGNIAIIFADSDCESLELGKIISVEEAQRCANIPQIQENGSLYSFTLKRNYINYNDMKLDKKLNESNWWDLHFSQSRFVVGNCCAQAIIADLGKVDFESQNSSLRGLDYLNNFKAGRTLEETQKNELILQAGVKLDGVSYRKTAQVNVGHVYALRSISYELREKKNTARKNLKILSDKTIFFKVAEIQQDGSLVLLWRNFTKRNKS